MPQTNTLPPKPRSEEVRSHLTRLPELTPERLKTRQRMKKAAQFLVRILTRTEVFGLENFPDEGPALVVFNHLGDADGVVGLAHLPLIDAVGKVELYDLPVLGKLLDAYGVIWIHRGQADMRAVRVILRGFKQGRIIGIAPEGRQSVTGALEEGTGGAAFLAVSAGVPVVPITFTGTEDKNIYGSWLRLRRGRATMTVGKPFRLEDGLPRKEAILLGTETIMRKLAAQLPPEYRGVYADV